MSPTVPEGADKALLTVAELATFLNIGANTVRQWCARDKIPHGKLEGNIRFGRDQIQAWLDDRWIQPASSDPEAPPPS